MFSEDGLHATSYSDHNMDEVDSLNSDVVTMPLPANIDSGTSDLPPSTELEDGYASPEEVRVEGAVDISKSAQSSTDILNSAHSSFVDALKSGTCAVEKTMQNIPPETDIENIRNLERLVCEACVHSAGTTLSLPWEHPSFAGVFGESVDIFLKFLTTAFALRIQLHPMLLLSRTPWTVLKFCLPKGISLKMQYRSMLVEHVV